MAFIGKKPTDAPLTSSDVADGIITSAKIADGTIVNDDVNASAAIVASKLSGAGITVADQWRLTANLSVSSQTDAFVTSNLERVDNSAQGTIGTAISESSGVFTFPSTGVYLVSTEAGFYMADDARYVEVAIYATVDNSNYILQSSSNGFIQITQSSNTYTTVSGSTLIDVTDTSNVKVKFAYARKDPNTVTLAGNSDRNTTFYTFIRLGDT